MARMIRGALEELVDRRSFAEAEEFCARQVAGAQATSDQSGECWWTLQMGLVCFLNEADDEASFVRAPALVDRSRDLCPDDPWASFWAAYVGIIRNNFEERRHQDLRDIARRWPDHGYVQLTLSSDEGGKAAEDLLSACLRVQPGNARATFALARLIETDDPARARALLRSLIDGRPYVENRLGIMNRYANGVLTGALHIERYRADAESRLRDLEM